MAAIWITAVSVIVVAWISFMGKPKSTPCDYAVGITVGALTVAISCLLVIKI